MSVSIYLNNQQVQIVIGNRGRKGTFQDSIVIDAPEGSIINGLITDSNSFVGFLKETWNRYRLSKTDVHLVVGGNKIHGRNVEVPMMSASKTKEYLTRELADMEKEGSEYIFCYNILSGKSDRKLKNYYVEMADEELIKDYVDIFKEAGITLKSLVSAEGSILSLLDKTVNGYYKTFILQVLNGNLVTNILWVDGAFNYYNTVRCFNDIGTGAYYEDCARSLSNLNQFIQAHKIEQKIEKILIAGSDKLDMAYYGDLVSAYGIDASVDEVNQGLGQSGEKNHRAQQVIYALCGLYTDGTKESNFLANIGRKDKKSSINPELKKNILIVAVALAIMLVIFFISLGLRTIRQIKYNALIEYNEDPMIVSQAMMFDAVSEKRDRLASQSNSIENVVKTIYTYPVLTKDIEKVINDTAKGYADIEIGSFDAENGVVNVTAKARDVDRINQYIYRLEEQEIFNSVKYTGYNYNQDGTWSINVTCTFAESVGREVENDEE
ncbi:MAG: hypothetical protein K5776_09170 [Lachnospiraceae bacterium]|nr:hypothetical protein [Lachnospiraceae bacterium]